MGKDTWLLLSPILAVAIFGALLVVLGLYWMIFKDVEHGVQPFLCGLTAFAMTSTTLWAIHAIEPKYTGR